MHGSVVGGAVVAGTVVAGAAVDGVVVWPSEARPAPVFVANRTGRRVSLDGYERAMVRVCSQLAASSVAVVSVNGGAVDVVVDDGLVDVVVESGGSVESGGTVVDGGWLVVDDVVGSVPSTVVSPGLVVVLWGSCGLGAGST